MTEHEMNYGIAAMETFFEYEMDLSVAFCHYPEIPLEKRFEMLKTMLESVGYELEILPDGNISIGKVSLH